MFSAVIVNGPVRWEQRFWKKVKPAPLSDADDPFDAPHGD